MSLPHAAAITARPAAEAKSATREESFISYSSTKALLSSVANRLAGRPLDHRCREPCGSAVMRTPVRLSDEVGKLYAMADPLAILGAVTGTTSLGVTLWRERRGIRRSMGVERGWQFVYDDDGNLLDVWVCVMAYNTGRRPLHIEHAGWEFLVEGPREMADAAGIGPDNRVWVTQRFEIALNGETIETVPDGPSVKIWTRLVPVCAYGIDPGASALRPFVMTVPETYWYGPEGPLIPETPPGRERDDVIAAFTEITNAELDPKLKGNPKKFPDEPAVHGLMRLVLDGDVERTSDLLDGKRASGQGP